MTEWVYNDIKEGNVMAVQLQGRTVMAQTFQFLVLRK